MRGLINFHIELAIFSKEIWEICFIFQCNPAVEDGLSLNTMYVFTFCWILAHIFAVTGNRKMWREKIFQIEKLLVVSLKISFEIQIMTYRVFFDIISSCGYQKFGCLQQTVLAPFKDWRSHNIHNFARFSPLGNFCR